MRGFNPTKSHSCINVRPQKNYNPSTSQVIAFPIFPNQTHYKCIICNFHTAIHSYYKFHFTARVAPIPKHEFLPFLQPTIATKDTTNTTKTTKEHFHIHNQTPISHSKEPPKSNTQKLPISSHFPKPLNTQKNKNKNPESTFPNKAKPITQNTKFIKKISHKLPHHQNTKTH